MFESVRLTNFKNFRDATLPLGPITVVVGTNASGKSNLRDAFRFLHGIGRGYTLAEIIGEKYGDGGERVWRGIRGGVKGIAKHGETDVSFGVKFRLQRRGSECLDHLFMIRVDNVRNRSALAFESVEIGGRAVVDTFTEGVSDLEEWAMVRFKSTVPPREFQSFRLSTQKSSLVQLFENSLVLHTQSDGSMACEYLAVLEDMRFLDLSPDEMKRPSLPGQLMLGDRGENLSSVLMAICDDALSKRRLTEWLQELTPIDVIDLDFVEDQQGRVSVTLVEASGTRTSVHSASDGTLRFLGLLAALMGPKRPRVLFLDEIDTGIHPARLHLLVQLIEHHTAKGDLQVIATTHSPQLLALLSERSRNDAVLVYRLHDATDAGIKRIVDIPHAREVLQNESLSRLHESGWLENAVEFAQAEPAS